MALQGSVGEIRTNEEHFSLKNEKEIKNSQPQTKFTGSYKKKSAYFFYVHIHESSPEFLHFGILD